MIRTVAVSLGFAAVLPSLSAQSVDWPQFRGPDQNAVSAAEQLPTKWGPKQNVGWKVKVPGRGWSSPIVTDGKVFVTTAVIDPKAAPPADAGGDRRGGGQRGGRGGFGGGRGGFGGRGRSGPPDVVYTFEVHCFDQTTGKPLWQKVALKAKPRIATHRSNTYASETMVADGERVYAYFGMTGLFCYDFEGKLVWKKDLGAFQMMGGWGTSSSPVLHDGRLFLQIDNEEKSFLVALDAKTGEEKWRKDRDEKSTWSTPFLWRNEQRVELVANGSKVRSYDPKDGTLLWELNMGGSQFSASPVADKQNLYVGTGGRSSGGRGGRGGRRGGFGGSRGGFGGSRGGSRRGADGGGRGAGGAGRTSTNTALSGALIAVRAGASDDITPKQGETKSDGVAWATPNAGPPMASPLLYQGRIYILEQRAGRMNCYDAKTGARVYRERFEDAGAFWASPWAYDDKIFCLDEEGQTHVIQSGPEFKILATNTLAGEKFWATTAIAHGSLFFRSTENLYCVRPQSK